MSIRWHGRHVIEFLPPPSLVLYALTSPGSRTEGAKGPLEGKRMKRSSPEVTRIEHPCLKVPGVGLPRFSYG
jgi:hypothetical protein